MLFFVMCLLSEIPLNACILLTAKRDSAAALRFFRKAIRHYGEPEVVTIDKSGANAAALATLNADKPDEEAITVRQSKYLNNLIEQDHRNIKRRSRPMLGFSSFRRAQTILAGIELIHMIRKGQYQHLQSEGLSPAEQFSVGLANTNPLFLGSSSFVSYYTVCIGDTCFLCGQPWVRSTFWVARSVFPVSAIFGNPAASPSKPHI